MEKNNILPASLVCEVDFLNLMDDGTAIIGVTADFTYSDGSSSQAAASNLFLRKGDATAIYSNGSCVRKTVAHIVARRLDGQVEVKSGQDPDAPAGKCWTKSVWQLRPVRMVSEQRHRSGGLIEVELVSES